MSEHIIESKFKVGESFSWNIIFQEASAYVILHCLRLIHQRLQTNEDILGAATYLLQGRHVMVKAIAHQADTSRPGGARPSRQRRDPPAAAPCPTSTVHPPVAAKMDNSIDARRVRSRRCASGIRGRLPKSCSWGKLSLCS